jgi:hypothetical protein
VVRDLQVQQLVHDDFSAKILGLREEAHVECDPAARVRLLQAARARRRARSGALPQHRCRQAATKDPADPASRTRSSACGADVEEWVSAWRALSLREFEKANPSSILSGQQVSPADRGQDGIVRPLKRPAR